MNFTKNIILFFIILSAIFSCRNTDEPQQIDQILNIYIDSLGQDMLNSKIKNSYQTVVLKDIGGLYDQTSISGYSLKKNTDTVAYIEYLSGAKRNRIDSISPLLKHYQSDIVLNLTKKVSATKTKTTIDTMKIQYTWTPELFQISKVFYNRKLVFTKTSGQANTIKIHK